MAKGIRFPEANVVLGAPTPEDAAAGTVYGLPALRYQDLDGTPQVLSCWELDDEEIDRIVRTRRIWLNNWGQTIAPTFLTAYAPFGDGGWLKRRS